MAASARRSRRGWGNKGWIGLGGRLWALRRCPVGETVPAKANVLQLLHEKARSASAWSRRRCPRSATLLATDVDPACRAHLA